MKPQQNDLGGTSTVCQSKFYHCVVNVLFHT